MGGDGSRGGTVNNLMVNVLTIKGDELKISSFA
jgi:hypothetical protein